MGTKLDLTVELERFAEACVANGRYSDVGDVMRSALRLLQDREEQREAFNRMLTEVEADADRNGTFTADSVARDMDDVIARS
jgi:antitoxin ParD1/3/4